MGNGLKAQEKPLNDTWNAGVKALIHLANVDGVGIEGFNVVLQQAQYLRMENLN